MQIKICGLYRDVDADHANASKPDYVGFILDFPKSHRNVSIGKAAEIRKRLDPGIKAVGVFVDKDIDYVLEAVEEIGLDVVQLHGHEDNVYIEELRTILDRDEMQPAGDDAKAGTSKDHKVRIWKAFKVTSEEDIAAAEKCKADLVLLDGGSGEGRSFNWQLAKGLGRPFALAGGLDLDNLCEAIKNLCPVLVDISSGVETDKAKDPDKMIKAVNLVRNVSSDI